MAEKKKRLANELFRAYDKDNSESLDIDEFLMFMEDFDPRIQPEGVRDFFECLGAENGLISKETFIRWIQIMFGQLPDDVFNGGMKEFLEGAKHSNVSVEQRKEAFRAL